MQRPSSFSSIAHAEWRAKNNQERAQVNYNLAQKMINKGDLPLAKFHQGIAAHAHQTAAKYLTDCINAIRPTTGTF